MMKRLLVVAFALLMASVSRAGDPTPVAQFELKNCLETIGVRLAPTATVLSMVPHKYTPVGITDQLTPIVVRTAQCDITVAGQTIRQRSIVQIGAVIVPPDGTGDINNYTLFYYTNDPRLYLLLNATGVSAQFVPTMTYGLAADNTANIQVPFPGSPRLSVFGKIQPSQQPAGAFVANWWQDTFWGSVKMQTTVPVIKIGDAKLELKTSAGNQLYALTGDTIVPFPLLEQFNTFKAASLSVWIQE